MAAVLKIKHQGEIYRLRLPADQAVTYEAVTATLEKVEGSAGLLVKYRDEEGDLCLFSEMTFQDFLAVSEHKAPGRGTYELELLPAAMAAKAPAREDSDDESSGSSDGSSSSGSSDSDDSDDDRRRGRRVGARRQEGPEPEFAAGFLEALAAEYVRGERSGVGHFLKREKVSSRIARRAGSVERRVRKSREPAAAIAQLARSWQVACPESCRGAACAAAEPSKEAFEIPKGKEDVARAYLSALVAEYIKNEENAVGKFLKGNRDIPRDVQKHLNRVEDDVRRSKDPASAIAQIAARWGVLCPEGCGSAGLAKARGGPPVEEELARAFLAALHAQYVAHVDGAVGEFYQALAEDVKEILEVVEEELREEAAGDFVGAITKLAQDWGLSPPNVEHEQAVLDAEAEASQQPTAAEVAAACAASPACAAAASAPAFDYSVPVVVGDGSVLTLKWNRGDNLEAVAMAFVKEHGLPEEEAATIANYLRSC